MPSDKNANARAWAQITVPAMTVVGLKYVTLLLFVGATNILASRLMIAIKKAKYDDGSARTDEQFVRGAQVGQR